MLSSLAVLGVRVVITSMMPVIISNIVVISPKSASDMALMCFGRILLILLVLLFFPWYKTFSLFIIIYILNLTVVISVIRNGNCDYQKLKKLYDFNEKFDFILILSQSKSQSYQYT